MKNGEEDERMWCELYARCACCEVMECLPQHLQVRACVDSVCGLGNVTTTCSFAQLQRQQHAQSMHVHASTRTIRRSRWKPLILSRRRRTRHAPCHEIMEYDVAVRRRRGEHEHGSKTPSRRQVIARAGTQCRCVPGLALLNRYWSRKTVLCVMHLYVACCEKALHSCLLAQLRKTINQCELKILDNIAESKAIVYTVYVLLEHSCYDDDDDDDDDDSRSRPNSENGVMVTGLQTVI